MRTAAPAGRPRPRRPRAVGPRSAEDSKASLAGRQFGTSGWDEALAVAVDADDNVLVVGTTWGDLAGTHQGNGDVFVRQYSPDGDEGWTEQFGTAFHELGLAIAVDGAGGIAEDWTFDPQTRIVALAIDASGDILAVGPGWRVELGFEVYVAKLTPAGDAVWSGLYGTGEKSDEPDFERDPVPATRRPTELWEELRGFEDVGHGLATDAQGTVYTVGHTLGDLGEPLVGGSDAFLRAYEP